MTCTGSYAITQDDIDAGTFTNTASVIADDVNGNPMAAADTWSFTTGAPPGPGPDEGPGGPILVIGDPANPFGRYFAEILRTEGLNFFAVTDISLVDSGVLNAHDVVILGEMTLSAAQVTLLTNWVDAGGKLIAMRPDAHRRELGCICGTPGRASRLRVRFADEPMRRGG